MKNLLLFGILILFSFQSFSQTHEAVNHNLFVQINPETSEITVTDSISIEGEFKNEFLLNAEFKPVSLSKKISLKKITDNADASDVGMDREDAEGGNALKLSKWKIKGLTNSFVISYHGKIKLAIEQGEENYQRGFSQSPGIIDTLGIYLAGSTFWVPVFEGKLMTFSLTTELPKNWKNVTQGKRTKDEILSGKHIDTWICDKPQEEVFLIAANFNEYSHNMNCGLKAMAFLRTPDESLANKYLEVTEQYMDMYQSMLGDYPYTKFALVENFWETGYGMPSFTLLGEKVIRFPWILHASYPHELLHNWWGNSVYVDFDSGNWCEGTTVFMSDHLIKEQRGAGDEYRRSTLQKFSNSVNKENDFPLNKFISRHDASSSSIGYGKAMMMWQMLRRKLGDETFLKGMQLFYESNKYKTASYSDIQKAMEETSGIDLTSFFDQWVNRKAAPELGIKDIKIDMYAGKYRINITIEQMQDDDVFNIDVPINIATEDGIETYVFSMDKKEQDFQISLKSKPLKLVVDPQYDVFRILNPAEVPPTLSKIWGSKNNLIIIPEKASKEQKEIYKKFAKQWQDSDNDNFTIEYDTDLNELPKDKTAWIIGFENKFAKEINQQLVEYNSKFIADSVIFENKNLVKKGNSFIFTLFDEKDINKQIIFISIENENAVAGLIRKLPHYGKYSYLAFSGDEPTNIAKGQWPVLNSPMVKTFSEDAQKISVTEPRKALATLKPVFSEKRMMSTIKYLASEELKGRGLGTPEIDQAAEYIAQQFEAAGLKPIKGTYYQKFTHKFDKKGELDLTNVIGVIPGTDPKLKDDVVVVSAHYDHLGFGWPDVRKGNEGKIHYGADDNASGVATIIELAHSMAKTVKPKRTIVFLACTAEEAGLIGSRYFVAHAKDYFSGEIFANVNIDTDGSLFDKKLLVLNANSAKEWKFIFMGTDYTTGVKSEVIDKDLDASDQFAFIEKGIPAIQLFTGATENYHRPTDTFDKIDGKGLVKVAIVCKEVLTYLADREDPMNFTGKTPGINEAPVKAKTIRKASTGSIPDFAYKGKGIKISSVMSGSAGEKAGLQAEDII
ncbi:MAG: M20/M25/M40 family metallo-hydrolase, partial [Bacteroidales bacterium]|nr:M20/M25/M40 family metallo-hydrolase [Bacteroidales bacterium]